MNAKMTSDVDSFPTESCNVHQYRLILAYRLRPKTRVLDPYFWVGCLAGRYVHVDVFFWTSDPSVEANYTNSLVYTAYMGQYFSAYANFKYSSDTNDLYCIDIDPCVWWTGLTYANSLCESNIAYNYTDLALCLNDAFFLNVCSDINTDIATIQKLYCSQAILLILRVMFPDKPALFNCNSRACSPLRLSRLTDEVFLGNIHPMQLDSLTSK